MSHLENISKKVLTTAQLQPMLELWRFFGKKVVFTNGCFDLLHLGHLDYLSKAADLGDIFIIGVNTDASVSRLKGPMRPVNDQQSRAMLLAAFGFVDAVVLFDEPTPKALIDFIQPDVLVKGNDYKAEDIVGYDTVMAKGGRVATIPLVEGYSTTAIINRIIQGN
ncbi:MAG: D-glycero-beta-D-manno-heptose 1-phosphate adenylyltransferase [Bacteroidia bacterium]|jgi:rfaE bifunctional protein nucleotidyltransferase chain/domain|nr:D-glycero-beta-D-manno-heptose 1-phosphate adenylyltransferase [Bacteroidia bacterium]